jgi:diguanylate cyclase (GGDEF)-like protein/putative nucleotidyltransferase with HDIG domain
VTAVGAVSAEQWTAFAAATVAASVGQLYVIRAPRNQVFHSAVVFVVAAATLLPPALLLLMCVAQHLPDWVKHRYPWYIQSFNICNYALNGVAAAAIVSQLGGADPASPRFIGFAVVAAVVFVFGQRVLLATMLWLARGLSLRDSRLFAPQSLSVDGVLAALGLTLAAFWRLDPWFVPVAITPLLMLQRTLGQMGVLHREAIIDAKTGLFNSRHFAHELNNYLAAARRASQPLSIVVADLDLLREINNGYGHLAGDEVLRGVAEVFRRTLRADDIAARFGGEEFSIILPGTSREEALQIAERLRARIAETPFAIEMSEQPLSATVSMGVAAFPADATTANELFHLADLAVYRAKVAGRNRVVAVDARPLHEAAADTSCAVALPSPQAGMTTTEAPVMQRLSEDHVTAEQLVRLLRERSTAAMAALSATVDARDAYTAGHSRRVQRLALLTGRRLGLSESELETLGHAALFHDIGKLAIPDSILLKPSGLTQEEWRVMQSHSEEGARIIARLGFLDDAVPAIRHHHERYDGRGYPHGLSGEEIPLAARIIGVADALDSMCTTRSYRPARPLSVALAELRSASGTQFCPTSVEALIRVAVDERLPYYTVEPPLRAAS